MVIEVEVIEAGTMTIVRTTVTMVIAMAITAADTMMCASDGHCCVGAL